MAVTHSLDIPLVFSRSDVAKVLNVAPLTIFNREKKGRYPAPSRSPSNYRIYTLRDIFHLQMLTYNQVYLAPILSLLWDKGYTDAKALESFISKAFDDYKTSATVGAVNG